MNTSIHRFASLVLGAVIGLAAWPALADDTELFVASTDPAITGAQPNILFVYDNSGSMDSEVLTQEAWNANTTFDGCYQKDGLYFSTTGTIPGCNSDNYIDKSANYCNASKGPLASVGTYTDRMLAWRSSNKTWLALNGSSKSRSAECRSDRGIHGQNTGDSKKYAAAGNAGPWATTAANEPAWNSNYTVWDGNWLNWYSTGGTVTKTRIEVVREVTNDLLQNLNGVNVGLMHFNTDQGGTVAKAITNIATSRSAMQSAVSALDASTYTPLSETLYEAANYYMGLTVDYGNVGPVKSVAASRVGNVITGTTYKKPATYACQKNYIVLLTDGLPTRDVGATGKIKALPDWNTTNVTDITCSGTPGSDGECMSDLSEYLYRHDLDATLAGLQNVTTYTIGFGVDLAVGDTTFLQATAQKGGGKYFPAGDTATLQAALTAIVYDILDDSTTFSTPTAPVNAFNRTQNLSDVFVSVFAPSVREHWPGNLKKYKLQGGRLVDAQDPPQSAVDPDTGFFADKSKSYWSDVVDGNSAPLGGAANELPVSTSRNLYTDVNGPDLNANNNAVTDANASITEAKIGAPDATERTRVLDWARGLDLLDEDDDGAVNDVRHVMGDPLHVRPVMVIYGGTVQAPDSTVFVSTNDGYLHAIDPDDGSELWAFVPSEMLGRLYGLYKNDPTAQRSYGLDGEISVFIENEDATPGIAGTERVILLFGMRRGGDTLYALDVTDRNNPQLMWKLNSNSTGFGALGQTWSPPVVASVKIDNTEYHAAIFGGGYDDGEDVPGYRTDSRGNAVYMVNALTGALLWSAGNGTSFDLNLPKMTHSIPAGIRVLDIDQDRFADRMYVGDMGGRVWRFDISNGKPRSQLVNGGVLASLGAADINSPTLADVRRFYATPDVARIVSGKTMYLSINIGSGHREHPLDTATDDEFFALRDYKVFDTIATGSYPNAIKRSNLTDITSDMDPVIPADSAGWRLQLNMSAGEKVVTESRTFANTVFFTSFSPGGNGDACVAAGGLNRLYVISVRDGSPLTNLDGSENSETLTAADRVRELNQGGIAPDPALFFSPPDDNPDPNVECLGPECQDSGNSAADNDGTKDTLCIGVECFDPGFPNPPRRTHWNQTGTE